MPGLSRDFFYSTSLPRRHLIPSRIPSRTLDTKSGEKEQTVWLMSWTYTSQIFICFRFVSSAFELIKIRNRATNFNKINECRRLDYSRSRSTFDSQETRTDLQIVLLLQQIEILNVWLTSKYWKIIPQVAWCATGVWSSESKEIDKNIEYVRGQNTESSQKVSNTDGPLEIACYVFRAFFVKQNPY